MIEGMWFLGGVGAVIFIFVAFTLGAVFGIGLAKGKINEKES